jgi:ADP-ribosylglycohydrolase
VRFGAPIEGWTYEEIRDNIGSLTEVGYLNEAPDKVFKPDDDTATPVILVRALEDYGVSFDLSAQQIAETLLNYLGDQHGTLWWGGYGVSTEHTAYLNLANGIPAPRSGSIAQNGATVAEQIGGQIFSDIWGLVAPNQPERAADLSGRASSITHDGNGIYGGRFVAALVSYAFVESDPHKLIEKGLSLIPEDSEYTRVMRAVIDFHAQTPDDWHAGFAFLKANFGYDRYPGGVHIIPNAGVIALALLYGAGDFTRTLQICNMAGWDTDCNVGNVGAIMGVALGLDGIDAGWRAPMNDLLIAASIVGTRNLLTIPQCADLFCRLGRALAGQAMPDRPRYHFAYPASTNNFYSEGRRGRVIHLQNVPDAGGRPALQASLRNLNKKGEARIFTRTYYRPEELSGNYYEATFSPLVYPGQRLTAEVYLPAGAPDAVQAGLYVYDDNHDAYHQAQAQPLTPGEWHTLHFEVPPLEDALLSAAGVAVHNLGDEWSAGALYLGALDWDGAPDYTLTFAKARTESGGISQWTRLRGYWRLDDGAYHGGGPGLCESYTGDIRWQDYALEAQIVPLAGDYHNINVRVQGARRSYAFGLAPDNKIAFYKKDGDAYGAVALASFAWQHGQTYTLRLAAKGATLEALVKDAAGQKCTLRWSDDAPYLTGQVGLSVWHGGHMGCRSIRLSGVT